MVSSKLLDSNLEFFHGRVLPLITYALLPDGTDSHSAATPAVLLNSSAAYRKAD